VSEHFIDLQTKRRVKVSQRTCSIQEKEMDLFLNDVLETKDVLAAEEWENYIPPALCFLYVGASKRAFVDCESPIQFGVFGKLRSRAIYGCKSVGVTKVQLQGFYTITLRNSYWYTHLVRANPDYRA
jgi:hypothetical protein